MAIGLLSDEVKIVQCVTLTAGAAGSSNINGSIIDTTGFYGCLFIVQFGTITAGAATSIKVQQDTVVGFGGAADLQGTAQTVIDTADDTIFYVDLKRPLEQFVRLVVLRATQNAVVGATAILYGARNRPVTQPAGVAGEKWVGPIEGTA